MALPIAFEIMPHYRSEGRRQGSNGVFGGSDTIWTPFVRIQLIMDFVTDDWSILSYLYRLEKLKFIHF